MIKETIIKEFYCDLCGKQASKARELKHVNVPVKFTTEQTEGRSCTPYFEQWKFDLCESCLNKVVRVGAYGAQGYNTYYHLSKKNEVAE